MNNSKKPENTTKTLEQRLDIIMNPKGVIFTDFLEGKYCYNHRKLDDKEWREHCVDTANVVAYLSEHNPTCLYDLEKLAEKYERTLTKAKSRIEAGWLEGKIIDGVYVPEGNPLGHFMMTGYNPFPGPLTLLGDKIVGARESAQKKGNRAATAFYETVEKTVFLCAYGVYFLTLPLMTALAAATKTRPNRSQRMYEKLEKYRKEINKFGLDADDPIHPNYGEKKLQKQNM